MTRFDPARRHTSPAYLIPADTDAISQDMLSLVHLDQQQVDHVVRRVPGGARNIRDVYPLSALQEGLLFHYLLSEVTDTYVLSTLLEFESEAQVGAWAGALQKVIDRHDILRSAVLWEELSTPVQVVYRCAVLPVHHVHPELDLDVIEQLKTLMTPTKQRMDIRHAPLVKLFVATDTRNARHFALLQVHHLVCDHQSQKILFAEILACLQGRELALPPSAAYRDYVARSLANAQREDAEAFFRRTLGDVHEPTALFGLKDVHGDGRQLREAHEKLEPGLSDMIRAQARRSGVSAARLFHAAWALVVARASGRDDIVFGTVLAIPGYADTHVNPMLGMAVNTLPLRLRLRGATAADLVQQTHVELKKLRQHAETSLTFAQNCSGMLGLPLFTAILNYRHNPLNPEAELAASMGIRTLARSDAWTNYPVAMLVDDLPQGFELVAQTDAALDPARIIGYLSTAIAALVNALGASADVAALSLSVLPDVERQRVLEEFNSTQVHFPRRQSVQALFEEQVEHHPQALALQFHDQALTYAQLNGRANQLARFLREQGVGPDRIVAVCVDRDIDLIISILATWKAGGAYVPVDPAYPRDRIAFMLEDAAPGVLLTQAKLLATLPESTAKVIAVDLAGDEIAKWGDENLTASETGAADRNLAYLIYTSGSTGRPKGVMIEHATLCNLAYQQKQTFRLGPNDRVLQFSSLSFDACVWECVNALTSGACLCLAPREDLIPGPPLLNTLRSMEITQVTLPPVAAGALDSSEGLRLRTLVVGGEACPPGLLQQWANGVRLINAYGPTEVTVCATMHECRADERTVPIGRPIANTHTYILDPEGEPVPIGVAGEIHIGGAGVARGYLNRPELTAQRFTANPFKSDPNGRLYQTGDLGRWREDGTIEFLGRNDAQVKVRGFRIELGEIEAQLVRHPVVREAVVVVRDIADGGRQIVAYFTSMEPSPPLDGLRAHLQGTLPEFMIPGAFVALESWPTTPNGKLDRAALPAPDVSAFVKREYEAPAGEIEVALAEIWQAVLHVEHVGRHDHFFELGGHSLAAMHVTMRIQSALELDVPMRWVLEHPVLEELAARVEERLRDCLIDSIEGGGNELAQLLEGVASMPEHEVDELMRKLSVRGQS